MVWYTYIYILILFVMLDLVSEYHKAFAQILQCILDTYETRYMLI